MGKVYLVIGTEDHEPSSVAGAFSDENGANIFLAACQFATRTHPECPDPDDDDSLWEEWKAAHKIWRATHPAGDNASYREWHVEAHELRGTPQESSR